jgi:hypothetical protein
MMKLENLKYTVLNKIKIAFNNIWKAGLWWRYLTPPPHRHNSSRLTLIHATNRRPLYRRGVDHIETLLLLPELLCYLATSCNIRPQRTQLPLLLFWNMFTEPLPSNALSKSITIWRHWLIVALEMSGLSCMHHSWHHEAPAWQWTHWHRLLRTRPCH